MDKNVKTEKPYTQVCVWPGTYVTEEGMTDLESRTKIIEFQEYMLTKFNTRVKFLEQITTFPDAKNGRQIPDTGGSIDTFFVVHSDDISRFAIPRLQANIRWIEDVLDNENYRDNGSVYPDRVKEYRTW